NLKNITMKKINILITFLAFAFSISSCETYDDFEQDRDSVVGFTNVSRNINNIPPGVTKEVEVNVFVSDLSNADRTFNIVSVPAILDLSAIPPQVETNPENYSFDQTVTIPANSREGIITV